MGQARDGSEARFAESAERFSLGACDFDASVEPRASDESREFAVGADEDESSAGAGAAVGEVDEGVDPGAGEVDHAGDFEGESPAEACAEGSQVLEEPFGLGVPEDGAVDGGDEGSSRGCASEGESAGGETDGRVVHESLRGRPVGAGTILMCQTGVWAATVRGVKARREEGV